jgi:hypothetical protein
VARRPSGPQPVTIGPTWSKDRRGRFILPRKTLGWDVLLWANKYLRQPDGPTAGESWVFTNEQARFLLHWYAVDHEGRFTYRSGVYRRMKGAGKNPFAAALSAVEFIGPCRFGGWKAGREPIAVPHPASWIQIAAVAREQNRNSMTLFPGLFSKEAVAEYGIDLGKEIIYAYQGRCRIESVTSSPRALEGGRSTFVVKDENHHWVQGNEGHAMSSVIARNLAKSRDGSARALAITNAHNPSEDSDASRDWDAYQEMVTGKSLATGFLYDSLEAPPETDMADPVSLKAGLLAARGDSHWLDVDRLMAEIVDPRTPASMSRRYYLNQVVAAEDAWCTPQQWDVLAASDYRVPDKSMITLGFDGSATGDHTALVGCEVETGHLFLLGHWDPAISPDGRIPSLQVNAAVRQAFAKYDVVGFFADPREFDTYIDSWAEDFAPTLCVLARPHHAISWQMGGATKDHLEESRAKLATLASERFLDAIVQRALTHDGSEVFAQHVKNARAELNNYGISPVKESKNSARKIDALDAAILAWECRKEYDLLPEDKKRQPVIPLQIFI